MKKITLVKDIMSDLEKGDRTEKQLLTMKMREFQKGRDIPLDSRLMSTSTVMFSSTNWR